MTVLTLQRVCRAALASTFVAALVAPALAQNTDALPAGSTVNAVLTSKDINTKTSHVGDPFTMTIVPPYPNEDPNFANATIYGHVADVRKAAQGRKPRMLLAFDRVSFADGASAPLSGSIISMKTTHENTTARKGLGAGIGAAIGSQTIGRLLGGALGGVVGLLGGAIGGYLYAANDKANVSLVQGAQVTMQTSAPVEVPRQQAAPPPYSNPPPGTYPAATYPAATYPPN